MPRQVTSQDIMPLLGNMSDQEIENAADELHAFVAHRRAASKPGAQRAPFNVRNFFQNFLKIVQAVLPVIQPLLGAQPGTQQPPSNP